MMQIGFSRAFDRVNHQGIHYNLCSVGIGGSVLSILTVYIKLITARLVDGYWTPILCFSNILLVTVKNKSFASSDKFIETS